MSRPRKAIQMDEAKTDRQLARENGVALATIQLHRQRNGIKSRPERRRELFATMFDPKLTVEQMMNRMTENGHTISRATFFHLQRDFYTK